MCRIHFFRAAMVVQQALGDHACSHVLLHHRQKSEENKARVCRFIEAFTSWDPATRVEQYALLHLGWELAAPGDAKWRAVAERLEKALAPAPVQAQVPPAAATAAPAPPPLAGSEDQPLA